MAERIFTDIELLRQIDELEGPVWIGEQQDGQLMNPLVIRGIVRDLGISDRKAAVISVAMIESDMNLHYPIEYLVFQLEDPSSVDEFIRKDKEVWTAFLEKSPAFYYKEMWVNDSNPGEVHSIIAWKDMKPVLVNGECNITRGHFHQALNCDEIYFCFQGEGLLLYMDENGKCWAEKMSAGSVHYIDGRLAHRLVNTGDGELHIGACPE